MPETSVENVAQTIRVLIVIVNYRTPLLVKDCLDSILENKSTMEGLSVVVLDNDSKDDSVALLSQHVADRSFTWCTVVQSEINGGYSYGNNLAIKHFVSDNALPEYVLFLNPDTRLRAEAISTLVQFMDNHPDVGIAGSRLEDPDGTVQQSSFQYPSWMSELSESMRFGILDRLLANNISRRQMPTDDCQTDWVAGASMIVRKQVLDDVGMFDESYFLYFEEVDFCLRARRAGWSCWYVPSSRVIHFVGQATGISDHRLRSPRRPRYWFDSRRRFFLKNYGCAQTLLADLIVLATYPIWRFRRLVQRKEDLDPPHYWRDLLASSSVCKGCKW